MKEKLIPVDCDRCQAEIASYNAWILGGSCRETKRCDNKPKFVVTENAPNPQDGMVGSMSLCPHCYGKFIAKLGPDYATCETVKRYQKRTKK